MSYAIPLPVRPRLDFYKKLAKELLRASSDALSTEDAVRAWAVRWLEASGAYGRIAPTADSVSYGERSFIDLGAKWVEQRWQEVRKKRDSAAPLLADAQFFLAREHGFLSWPKFAEQVRALENALPPAADFEAAVDAIVVGDERELSALLCKDPSLVNARSLREHHSTLLHYCSANGVEDYRQRTPQNIVAIARMLMDAGAEVNAESEAYGGGSTALGLTATSVHPERAGVQIGLMELLLDRGATIEKPGGVSAVSACLRNGREKAAQFLAGKGARLDLEGAAGLGELAVVKRFFTENGALLPTATAQQRADGFKWACGLGRARVVEFLLERGMAANASLSGDGQRGLHWAAVGGHPEIARMLLAHGADVNARETGYGGTPVGWALHGWGHRADGEDGERYYAAVEVLVAAGAAIGSLVSHDQRMMAALLGESPR
jgi:ankyrin repeat protein